ncbi:hypothetical protein, partial [Desulfovibrio sp. ZJ746]|uniref:hypothetical protein n=1 Tax=Desulfovibrio sp. ZJ746 TaxID=2709795 RepID=UPI00197ED202
ERVKTHATEATPAPDGRKSSGFRAGIFCSGKERKLAATGAYQDIRDRDASAARRRRTGVAFRAGIFCSGKEGEQLTPGAY